MFCLNKNKIVSKFGYQAYLFKFFLIFNSSVHKNK